MENSIREYDLFMTVVQMHYELCFLISALLDSQNIDPTFGQNVVFVVYHHHKSTSTMSSFLKLFTRTLTDYLNYSYSLGLCSFINLPSVEYKTGKDDEECSFDLSLSGIPSYNNSTIADALSMVHKSFDVHPHNKIFAPNLCILLTTSHTENKSEAFKVAARLKDSGVSLLVIGVGPDVSEYDIQGLASSNHFQVLIGGNIYENTTNYVNYTTLAVRNISEAMNASK